jgi:hypothetical protein
MYSEWRSGAFSRAAAGFTGTSEIVAAEQPGLVPKKQAQFRAARVCP